MSSTYISYNRAACGRTLMLNANAPHCKYTDLINTLIFFRQKKFLVKNKISLTLANYRESPLTQCSLLSVPLKHSLCHQ